MNKALEEFKELRLVYSGRIDEAIKDNNDEALEQARAEYKKILEKYMNIACQVLSSHTNHPFRITKKTHKGTVLRGEKSVLKDIESMRDSLNFIKLSDTELSDIKNAIDVVEDYYNKILSESSVNRSDKTKFNFRIIYGSIIVPIFVLIMSLISGLIIYKFLPSFQNIASVKDFINLLGNSSESDNMLMFLVFFIVNGGLIALLLFIYNNKTKDCILNKKQTMLIPVVIINLLFFLGPLDLLIDYLFGPVMSGELIGLVKSLSSLYLIIISVLIFIFGLVSNNYEVGDFRVTMGIGHIIMIILIFISFIVPIALFVIVGFMDLSIDSVVITLITLLMAGFLNLIMVFVYLIYLLVVINKQVFFDESYELTYRVISIIASVLLVIGSIILMVMK